MPLSWDPPQEGGDLEGQGIVPGDFLLDFLLEMSNFRGDAWGVKFGRFRTLGRTFFFLPVVN